MYPNVPKTSWRCGSVKSSLFHIFWNCLDLRPFWSQVFIYIKRLTHIDLTNDPVACLLHLTPTSSTCNRKFLLQHLLNAAKVYPSMWMFPTQHLMSLLIASVNGIILLENLTATLRNALPTFSKIWHHWIQFRDTVVYTALLSLSQTVYQLYPSTFFHFTLISISF